MSNIYGFYKQKHQSTWVTESKNKSFYSQGHKGIKSGLAGKHFQNIKSITLYIQTSLNVRTDLLLYIQQHRIYCHELLWDFNRFLAPSSVKKWMCCKIMNVKSLRGKLHTSVLHCIQVWFPPAIPKKQNAYTWRRLCYTVHFDLVNVSLITNTIHKLPGCFTINVYTFCK